MNDFRALERVSGVYFSVLVSVFLLVVPVGGYEAIGVFKYRLFLGVCLSYCVIVVLFRLQLAIVGIEPIGGVGVWVRKMDLSAKLLLLMLLLIVVSAVLSRYGGVFVGAFRQEGMLTYSIYILSCVFVAKYLNPKRWMLWFLGICVVLFCAISFIQLAGANPFVLFPRGHNFYSAGAYFPERFIGTIGNVGLAGAFLSLVAGVFAMAVIKSPGFKECLLLAIPLFLVVWLIFALAVDAAILAVSAGFLLMLPIAIIGKQSLAKALFGISIALAAIAAARLSPSPLMLSAIFAIFAAGVSKIDFFDKIPIKWYRAGSVGFVLIAIFASIVFVLRGSHDYGSMLYEASQILRGNWDDSFGSARVYIWRNVVEQMQFRNLLFGTGPDTLGHWPIAPFGGFCEEQGIWMLTHIDAAHNEYLHMLATIGLLPLLCYLLVLAIAAIHWWREPQNTAAAIAGAGVLFYCIQAFFGISMPITAPFFWACLAILISKERVANK